ncbi:MAG: serine/threonine protein kinase, partial [Verrucomicrobia bacterium]|nr:serine/threonine protein kinase [Verrucomicrobiota bacterium]
YFELSDSTQMIQSHEGSYIFHDNKWRRILTTPEKGTHSQVLLCQEIAFKFLHTPNEKGWTDIKRSESILQRVNPDGLAIGIQKRPITELALRNITTYHIEPSGVITTSNKHAVSKLEEPFLSDCIDALFLIQDTEIPSIAACLVQGSITLIGNGIYPFDVKLDNIGYLGNGRAVHIDLGGSYDISEDNWELLLPTHTSKYNIKDEALTALENTSSESKKQQLEKIHIFQLGIALFGLAAKTLPYNILDSNGCIAPFPTEVFPEEQKDQLRNTNIYSENQINMIISMIAKIPEERPSLQEIQSVFPVDLIL